MHPLYEIIELEYPILKKEKIRLIQFHTPEELVDFIQDKPAPTNPSVIIGKDKGVVVNIISGDGTPLDTESTSITIKDGTKSTIIHCEKDELDAISLQASREAMAAEMNKRGYHNHRQEFFDNIRRYINNGTDEIMKAITLAPTVTSVRSVEKNMISKKKPRTVLISVSRKDVTQISQSGQLSRSH